MKQRIYIAIDLKSLYASLPLLPPSKATASPDADGCLKSSSV